jgi:murein DD-endopeptidase MepM/ murein hydrolase activator NlpD
MKVLSASPVQCDGDIRNACDIKYIHCDLSPVSPPPLNLCLELEMTRRNDVQRRSAIAGIQVFQRLGYCLTSLGVLSSSLAYSQTIANAQTGNTAPLASKALTSNDAGRSLAVAAPASADPVNVAPPESVMQPEVAPAPIAAEAPLEVPAASIAAPSPIPSPDSRSAADLLPVVPDASATDAAPAAVEIIETPVRPIVKAPTKPANPVSAPNDRQRAAKPTVKPTVKPATKAPVKAAKAPGLATPIAPEAMPIVQAEITPTAPASAVQVGPISLSSAGINFGSAAVQPYFNPRLQLPPLPGLDQLRMVFPIAIPAPITSLFGWRIHPISGTQRLHTGTDVGAPMGAPVMAVMGGRVILADNMGGYGITVAIEHDNGIRQTLYAHMSELFVRPGDIVQQGTVVGRVGSTGASTGPHLHFELRQMLPDGTWVAQDASPLLERSMAQLVQSLQIAQQPQQTALKPSQSAR